MSPSGCPSPAVDGGTVPHHVSSTWYRGEPPRITVRARTIAAELAIAASSDCSAVALLLLDDAGASDFPLNTSPETTMHPMSAVPNAMRASTWSTSEPRYCREMMIVTAL